MVGYDETKKKTYSNLKKFLVNRINCSRSKYIVVSCETAVDKIAKII